MKKIILPFWGGAPVRLLLALLMLPAFEGSAQYCSPLTGNPLHSFPMNYMENVSIAGTTLNSANPVPGPGGYLLLDPNISSNTATLTQGSYYTMENLMTYSGVTSEVWIDFDQSGTFDASEFIALGQAPVSTLVSSGIFMIPLTATPGLTGMRVRSNFWSFAPGESCYDPVFDGETEDYLITIATAINCAGTPAGGIAAGPAGVCPSEPFSISVTGYTVASGLALQWESAPAGTAVFTPITGATQPLYALSGGQTAATDYRLVITCANSGISVTSTVVSVFMNPPIQCLCMPVYFYGGQDDIIASVTLGSLTNSSTGNVYPFYTDYTGQQPATIQIPDLQAGTSVDLTLGFGTEGDQYHGVWIDYDQNGIFDVSEFTTAGVDNQSYGLASTVVSIAIPATAAPGLTRMRIRGGDDYQLAGSQACGSSFSDFGEAEDYLVNIIATPLAIRLLAISAANEGQYNTLDWTTAAEQPGDYLVIERSSDGRNFMEIGNVNAQGQAASYSFQDTHPAMGVNYYRLKLVDASAAFSYSKVVTAAVKESTAFSVDAYPNPVSDILTVKTSGVAGNHPSASICDLAGKLLRTVGMNGNTAAVSMDSMAPGIYLLKYSDSGNIRTLKIIKQ